jgi:hypothetical protein
MWATAAHTRATFEKVDKTIRLVQCKYTPKSQFGKPN